jgi:hypothetical protein
VRGKRAAGRLSCDDAGKCAAVSQLPQWVFCSSMSSPNTTDNECPIAGVRRARKGVI